MTTQEPKKRRMIRWATLKGLTAMILFLLSALLAEVVVVLFAISLGVEDKAVLQLDLKPIGIDFVAPPVSLLFHIIPLSVVVVLAAVWAYLAKHFALKPKEAWKGKAVQPAKGSGKAKPKGFSGKLDSRLGRVNVFSRIWQRVRFIRATLRSTILVFTVFIVFIMLASLLVYPQLIYHAVSDAYRTNPVLLGFVKATGQALSFLAGIGNAFTFAMPAFKGFVIALGNTIKPLSTLDNAAKYLMFQNIAAWCCALIAMLYVSFAGKSYRYRKIKRR
ncbi:MAG: hypothetical protein QHH24_01480 [Candidatus Bathyarchaeota archaeon]|jgi:hypothetical protein|nr:hypothetical protein [Candidatus Bathyarchaeota archaeon]